MLNYFELNEIQKICTFPQLPGKLSLLTANNGNIVFHNNSGVFSI